MCHFFVRSAVFLIVVGDSDTVHRRNNNNNNRGQQSRQLCSTMADTLFSYSRLFSWYSWAAWLLAGLLGFGSSSKDCEQEWMEVGHVQKIHNYWLSTNKLTTVSIFIYFFASNLISTIMREHDTPVGINHYCNMFSIQWVLSHLAHGYYLYWS